MYISAFWCKSKKCTVIALLPLIWWLSCQEFWRISSTFPLGRYIKDEGKHFYLNQCLYVIPYVRSLNTNFIYVIKLTFYMKHFPPDLIINFDWWCLNVHLIMLQYVICAYCYMYHLMNTFILFGLNINVNDFFWRMFLINNQVFIDSGFQIIFLLIHMRGKL